MTISSEKIEKIREYAYSLHKEFEMTHDIEHLSNVVTLSLQLLEIEGGRKDILEVAALLHDVGYSKLSSKKELIEVDHAKISAEIAKEFLTGLDVKEDDIRDVCECIYHHSSSRAKDTDLIESYCLHDADKIDCLGFAGVLRMFAWDLTVEDNFYSISKHIAKLKKTAESKEGVLITESAKKIAKERNSKLYAIIDSLDC